MKINIGSKVTVPISGIVDKPDNPKDVFLQAHSSGLWTVGNGELVFIPAGCCINSELLPAKAAQASTVSLVTRSTIARLVPLP